MSPICPRQNESITLTCTDKLVVTLIWNVKPGGEIHYIAADEEGRVRMIGGNFTAVLVDVSNKSISNTGEMVADLTCTLTVPTLAITNGTIVTCETLNSLQAPLTVLNSSITLILAGS